MALSAGEKVDWDKPRFDGDIPVASDLLKAAAKLAGASVDIVMIDMPVATVLISSRREADRCVSRAFGAQGFAAHPVSADRPGQLGSSITTDFDRAGYPVATIAEEAGTLKRLVEVYPHPALLVLLDRGYRVPYKAKFGRAALAELKNIHDALMPTISFNLPLPTLDRLKSVASLKRYEDTLDALVCAWVGIRYLEGKAKPYGDHSAAIWCPTPEA